MVNKEQVLDERAALIEMYKAGFLDSYSKDHKLKTEDDWKLLNRFYKMAFNKRFGKKITKTLKKKEKKRCKEVKNNDRRNKK